MAISTIRKLTATDTARLEASALRFAARHGLGDVSPAATGMDSAFMAIECTLYGAESPRLARLWRAAFCRALGFRPCADLTIAYGYVGTRC